MIRAVGTVAGLIVILAVTLELFGLPVGHSLGLMLSGGFGDKLAVTRTLVKTIPLTIAALGIVVSWKAGLYNIGGEGQFVMGGLAACLVASWLMNIAAPGWISVAAILIASIVGGALWGGIAGWLKTARGVEVVISTILLNFVALQVLDWAVSDPLKDPHGGVPLTKQLPDAMMLTRFDRRYDLHSGIVIALLLLVAVWALLYWTKIGFRIRLVGEGERAARASGVSIGRVKIVAMLISGGLCGLAGGVEYTGVSGQLGTGFAQGWGFLAIPVALLGGLHPLWVGLSALYFGALFAGSRNLAGFTEQGTTLIYVIQAAAVLGLIGVRSLIEHRRVPVGAA